MIVWNRSSHSQAAKDGSGPASNCPHFLARCREVHDSARRTVIDTTSPSPELPLNAVWREWSVRAHQRAASGWPDMVEQLRHLQNEVAATAPPDDVVDAVTALIVRARSLLGEHRVGDADQIFGRLLELPERGQSLSPPLRVVEYDEDRITAETMFGRFHSGIGAVHGGAIALLFDDVLGRLADLGTGPPSRTAWLRVDYRSITPVDEPLTMRASVVERIGRKRFVEATLSHGDRLCAEARALFVARRSGQVLPPRPQVDGRRLACFDTNHLVDIEG